MERQELARTATYEINPLILNRWSARTMSGFDREGAKRELELSDDYEPMVMVAIGRPAPKERLNPVLRERGYPSDRKPLAEMVMEGRFGEG